MAEAYAELPMPSFDHELFLRHLGVQWTKPSVKDLNEDHITVAGEIDRAPEPAAVERAFVALGFSWLPSTRRDGVVEHTGRRGVERLTCWPGSGRARRLHFTWDSHRRVPVVGGMVTWGGRSWPALFDETVVYHRSSDMLVLFGRVPATGFGSLLGHYRAVLSEAAFESRVAYEPDLAGELMLSDGEFEVTLEDRQDGEVMLVIERS